MTKPRTTRTSAVLALKQVFERRDEVTFDEPVIRHCNASQRTLYTGNRMQSARGEAAEQAQRIASVGLGC